jgi:hypothetical protein
MVHLINPRYRRRRFFRPKRRIRLWSFVRHYQLLELFLLTGGIALVWLGSYLDNRSKPIASAPPAVEIGSVGVGTSSSGVRGG